MRRNRKKKKKKPSDFKGQTKKKIVKDPLVKLFEVDQRIGLTSATIYLTFR